MTINKQISENEQILLDINNLKSRIKNYDWEYRFSRFQEKMDMQRSELTSVLNEIKEK
ncbi:MULTISPECIES: hypothetical protein [Vagococcus]|uniref:Uncharacterized protein n=1 Tax=Vagococcus fluvialis bH819 TaxID=1255619 RepID=A0A1X6WTB4_9ENTE|nr:MULTISPECIES: hypothetical protein [Vagococcus]SLM86846.1 hypothetical protein FM121_12165 [Vagococcus fluvialis bH819]